jgi:hypothetical protein
MDAIAQLEHSLSTIEARQREPQTTKSGVYQVLAKSGAAGQRLLIAKALRDARLDEEISHEVEEMWLHMLDNHGVDYVQKQLPIRLRARLAQLRS